MQTNIKVAVRVRPNNRKELECNQRTIIKIIDSTTILFDPDEEDDEFFYQGVKQNFRDLTKRVNKKLSMEFDRVFDADATNDDIFEECTMPLIESVMNGYNCSVFVYGATGAGKTYTMLGNEGNRGLTYLTMQELFRKIEELSENRKFDIGVSYLEVYNESIMDLLTKSGPLKLREDANGVIVRGLILQPITNAEQLLGLLSQGNANRTQHPTDANAESSRSHAVFQVHIRMTEKKTGQKRTVKLSMIDLAGSERAASTRGIGVRFKEGASINKSLLALGNCINKLADGMKHIPYRDSNLTRILKDSLGGNCRTLMVANVSPSSLTYEDTYNTLKYASRAKNIRLTLRQNVMKSNMPKEFYIKKVNDLMIEVENLKGTHKSLEEKLAVSKANNGLDDNELQSWYRKIDAVYSVVFKAQEYYYGIQSKEKILNIRSRMKQTAEKCRDILVVDSMTASEDKDRFEASVKRIESQIEKQKEERARWREKLQESLNAVSMLRKEIQSLKSNHLLKEYLRRKDMEVEKSKQIMENNHILKINELYHYDSKNAWNALSVACDIVQTDYLSLRYDKAMDLEFKTKLDKLSHLIHGHGIRFKNEDDRESSADGDLTFDAFSADSDNEVQIQINGNKRISLDDTDISTKRPKIIFEQPSDYGNKIYNLNETRVLGSSSDRHNDISSSLRVLKVHNKKQFVSSLLSEENSNSSNTNRQQIANALLKSNITPKKVMRTVRNGIKKENRRNSLTRVCKSPKTTGLTARALASTSNFLKRHKAKTAASETPTVKINRTASMRLKK